MGLEYLKITPEIMLKISAYDDEQQGRLLLAMIAYAMEGKEPQFDGIEKFIWPVLKLDIDMCSAAVEKQKANGSRGGRPPKTETQQKPNENHQNPKKPNESQTKPNESLNTNIKTNTNTNTKKEEVVDARARESAAAAADEHVIGIDGSDLTAAGQEYDKADELVRRFRLPDTDQSREAVLEDMAKVGFERVEKALKTAALGNSKPMLSVNFYRAVLKGEGKAKAAAPPDTMLRYTAEQRKKTYSAAILDFDEVADG